MGELKAHTQNTFHYFCGPDEELDVPIINNKHMKD